MSPSFIRYFRYLLAGAAGLAALAAIAAACGSGGGGNIGDYCMNSNDCQNQYECLPVDDAGACSKTTTTCQQACTSMCDILGGNWTCEMVECGNPGLCALHSP